MKLFVASSSYNLFNYINIKCNLFPNEEVDLIISDFNTKNIEYYKNLQKTNLFKHVYFIEQVKFYKVNYIKYGMIRFIGKIYLELKSKLCYKKFLKKHCPEFNLNIKYDEIYVDVFGFMPRFVFNYCYSKNRNVKVFIVEVGVESYYDMYENKKASKVNMLATRKIRKNFQGYFLYNKEIANVGKFDVSQIPKININNNYIVNKFNTVFSFDGIEKIEFNYDRKYLFLDQQFDDMKEADELEKYIVDILKDELSDKFFVKLHPRTDFNSERYKDIEKIEARSTYEILCLNNLNLLEYNIITPFSTSAALPKLLFDREPQIICLAKIFKDALFDGDLVLDFFQKLKMSYRDKRKIIIPENLDEFIEILRELKNNSEK